MGRPIFGANRTVAGFIDAVEGEVHRGSSWTRRVVLRAIVLLPAGGRRGYDEKALGFERPVEQAGYGGTERRALVHNRASRPADRHLAPVRGGHRPRSPDERRVGKACGSTFNSRWS